MLNRKQAEELFEREAILLGTRDIIAEDRARELFGDAAYDFAVRQKGINGYGIGDYTLFGLTWNGVMIAVTYNNVCEARKKEAVA